MRRPVCGAAVDRASVAAATGFLLTLAGRIAWAARFGQGGIALLLVGVFRRLGAAERRATRDQIVHYGLAAAIRRTERARLFPACGRQICVRLRAMTPLTCRAFPVLAALLLGQAG